MKNIPRIPRTTKIFLPLVEWVDPDPFTVVTAARHWQDSDVLGPRHPAWARLEWAVLCHLKTIPERRGQVWRFIERLGVTEGREGLHLFERVLRDRYPGWRPGYLAAVLRHFRFGDDLPRDVPTSPDAMVRTVDAREAELDTAEVALDTLAGETLMALVGKLRPLLTPREVQVLALRLEGFDDPEIAMRLGVRTETVNALGRRIAGKARRLLT